ncbi:hypothetical protein AQJ27_44325 [Streptomyces olivochromogenes]|uniref:Uncharacterized protein n=1 Tax=Streptomyces olivochromogenes TaxID=1963 RepID=A0A250VTE5_STROL|nr:hypothetical protein AQJ27_44325 [Streptomyces olivochromogenes]GAX57483.1 hypothetical protein SO3561_09053 [Streptomyces olivochromogenes]
MPESILVQPLGTLARGVPDGGPGDWRLTLLTHVGAASSRARAHQVESVQQRGVGRDLVALVGDLELREPLGDRGCRLGTGQLLQRGGDGGYMREGAVSLGIHGTWTLT